MNDLFGSQTPIRRNSKEAKILLIEDNPDHCALIKTGIQKCMPEVELLMVATAEQAQHLLNDWVKSISSLPRLILLDLYLPSREDGLQLVQWLKNPVSPYRLIPITLLSHSKKNEDIQMSYDVGANSYIMKPTSYPQWIIYFESLRQYWLHTVTLPCS